MLIRARLVILAAVALTLAGCGNFHPGDAAVVDGHAISMKKFDKDARMYCSLELQLASQGGEKAPTRPNNEVRQHAISDLVTVIVARDLAKQKGVTPDSKSFQRPADELANIAKVFPKGDDAKVAESILETNAEIAAIAVALGEQSTGLVMNEENQDQLFTEGQAAIQKAFKDHDVTFSPRFSLSKTGKVLDQSGSISVPDVDFEAPTGADLPPAQRCG